MSCAAAWSRSPSAWTRASIPRRIERIALAEALFLQRYAAHRTKEATGMIMRTWRGAVRNEDAARYLEHQDSTGVREYRETPGNLGALVLQRRLGELIEVTTVSFWTSMDAVKAFAGDDPERAKFYPGDDELLAEKDLHADHFEVVSGDLDPSLLRRG
jgi:heme-degrading monooxygenase HmoA